MRICHVGNGVVRVSPRSAGGIERYIHYLALHQAREHEVFVVDAWPATSSDGNYHVIPVRARTAHGAISVGGIAERLLFCLEARRRLRQLIASVRPDVVHFHNQFPGALLMPSVKAMGVQAAYTVHNRLWSDADMCRARKERLRYWLDLRAIRMADRVVTLNRSTCRNLTEHFGTPSARMAVIPVGVDIEDLELASRERDEASPVSILCVARIAPYKNQLALIQAMERVVAAHANVRLLLVGPYEDEAYRRTLDRTIDHLGLVRRVQLLGPVPLARLLKLYGRADLFVLPSRLEGQPQAALEAMACGLPVLLSDIPPHRELAEEGVALLADVNNPTSLAQEIVDLIDHEERRAVLGRRAREHVKQHYSWESVSRRVVEWYLHPCAVDETSRSARRATL